MLNRSEAEKMSEAELGFDDDKLFLYTPLPQYGDGIYAIQLVMTKDIFQECYRRCVEPQEKRKDNE